MFGIEVNWDAVGAIGTCLGSLATFITIIIALYPYIKRVKLYYTKYSNIEQELVLTIINGRTESMDTRIFGNPRECMRCSNGKVS